MRREATARARRTRSSQASNVASPILLHRCPAERPDLHRAIAVALLLLALAHLAQRLFDPIARNLRFLLLLLLFLLAGLLGIFLLLLFLFLLFLVLLLLILLILFLLVVVLLVVLLLFLILLLFFGLRLLDFFKNLTRFLGSRVGGRRVLGFEQLQARSIRSTALGASSMAF